jgi:hypothetical protein
MEVITNFGPKFPDGCLVYDSHLLKTYRACQRKYEYFDIHHIVSKEKKVAPSFGIAFHEGVAAFRIAKRDGKLYPEAYELGGRALLEAYKKYMPPEATLEVNQDDARSPKNALRLYTGYTQHYEPQALKFPHVEIPFAILLGRINNKDVIYVGIIDAVMEMQGRLYINDLKTSGWTIDEKFLEGFKMDQGLLGYTVAAKELLGVETNYASVHAIWVRAEPKTGRGKPLDEYFHTKELYWDNDQIEEWRQNTLETIAEIETKKASGVFIMDWGQNCGAFKGCEYRPICSVTPKHRPQIITMDYMRAIWTPLEDERLQKMED